VNIRRATTADIEPMHEIRVAVIENALSNPARITPQMYEDHLDRLGQGWVCEIDGRVIGFSFAARADFSIWGLFVFSQYERRGVGKQLLKCATDWLFEIGADRVTLTTETNTRADRFYSAQGWTRGEMKDDVEIRFVLSCT
jgi:GNAT superfamily N-acetyltransferase